jgi:hypothetical protein
MHSRKITINYENYQQKRRQANRICRRKEKQMIQKQLEETEKCNKQNEDFNQERLDVKAKMAEY